MKTLLQILMLILFGINCANAKPYSYSDYNDAGKWSDTSIDTLNFENEDTLPKVEETKEIYLPKNSDISNSLIKDIKREKNSFNGNLNGIVKKFHKNGYTEEINYENGKQNGVSKTYDNNSNLVMEWEFKDDLRHGWNKSYYSNGQLKMERLFQNDRLNGVSKHYYENGQLREEANYISITPDGPVKHGPYKRYFINGKLQFDVNYKIDVLDGPYKEYYLNGQLKVEGFYTDGKPNGLFTFYYENGKFRKEIKYKNGEKTFFHLTKKMKKELPLCLLFLLLVFLKMKVTTKSLLSISVLF